MTATMAHAVAYDFAIDRAIRATLYNAALTLDRGEYLSFLDWCTDDFSYQITTYGPEIRREMIWLESTRDEMQELLNTIPKHNRDRTPIVRHWSLLLVSPSDTAANEFTAISNLQVYRTELDGGVTSLFAIGRYVDRLRITTEGALLSAREVRLETRMLGTGYHVPF